MFCVEIILCKKLMRRKKIVVQYDLKVYIVLFFFEVVGFIYFFIFIR